MARTPRHQKSPEKSWSELPFPRLGDEPWQQEAVRWIGASLGRSTESHLFAVARSNPFAIEYLKQAPVLAVCDSKRLVKAIAKGGKLKEVLSQVGMAYPLRRLSAEAADSSYEALFRALSQFHPSALAQALPPNPSDHKNWVRQLELWRRKMQDRSRPKNHLLEWAMVHCSEAITRAQPLSDIADFAASLDARFEVDWTFDRAVRGSRDWHTELAKFNGAARQYKRLGVEFDQPIDYGDLPLSKSVDGLSVVALRSGAELHEEGRRMRHCLASYGTDVVSGKCRIFSFRKGETPLATMEIRHSKKTWHIVQIKGVCNAKPDQDVLAVARQFLDEINAAPAPLPSMPNVMAGGVE